MQIGISLQNNQGIADVQSIIQLARRAEELGSLNLSQFVARKYWRKRWAPLDRF